MSHLTVDLGARSYPIEITHGGLRHAGSLIAQHATRNRVFVITDEHVATQHLPTLKLALREANIEVHAEILAPGEASKTLNTIEHVLDWLFQYTPERNDLIIALGGGVIGDITGFVASITLRGIKFMQIPTTLLAMVDSSVGGKTGVNNEFGKNLIGSFYQPCAVLIDPELLKTLPQRELLAGYAEIVKYGLIKNHEFFAWLEKESDHILALQGQAITHAIHQSCAMKAMIVEADERESSGERALLNFGHTFGHALEKKMGYNNSLLHGEAVSIGMAMAFAFSAKLGKCSAEEAARVEAHLKHVGLPTHLPLEKRWKAEEIVADMGQDKKVEDGRLVLVLAQSIGGAYIEKSVDKSALSAFLAPYCV